MNGLVNPVDFDHVSWLQMQGSEPTDSAWCLSTLCLSEAFSKTEEWGKLWKGKMFFQLYFTQDARLKDFQGTEGGQLQNNLKLNAEFFLENSMFKIMLWPVSLISWKGASCSQLFSCKENVLGVYHLY